VKRRWFVFMVLLFLSVALSDSSARAQESYLLFEFIPGMDEATICDDPDSITALPSPAEASESGTGSSAILCVCVYDDDVVMDIETETRTHGVHTVTHRKCIDGSCGGFDELVYEPAPPYTYTAALTATLEPGYHRWTSVAYYLEPYPTYAWLRIAEPCVNCDFQIQQYMPQAEDLEPFEFCIGESEFSFAIEADDMWFMGRAALTLYTLVGNNTWLTLLFLLMIPVILGLVYRLFLSPPDI